MSETRRNRRHLAHTRQVAMHNARRRHHPAPAVYVLGSLPPASANPGVTVQIINRDDRIAVSNGTEWVWRGTDEPIA